MFWTKAMDRVWTLSQKLYGKTVTYQRPGFDAFPLVGLEKNKDRLEDPETGPFYSMYFRISDFDAASFTASVTAHFAGAPNSGGTVIFDGVSYTSQQTLNNAIPNQFFRGGSGYAAAESLAAAINAQSGYAGSAYSAATLPHPSCTATYEDDGDGTASVTVSYSSPGAAGDVITAQDQMSFLTLSSKLFSGGLPLENDLITIDGTLYRVSDVPEPDGEGGIHVRLERKAL